jgi:hypothetical protein
MLLRSAVRSLLRTGAAMAIAGFGLAATQERCPARSRAGHTDPAPAVASPRRDVEAWPLTPSSGPRRFLLSASAIQNWPGEEPFSQLTHPPEYTFEALAADVDVLGIFVEHYGVPWAEFANGEPALDHPWTQAMTRLAASARATGKPRSLQMVLSRDKPASRASSTPKGGLLVDSDWSGGCYDFRAKPNDQRAYVRYVAWMVKRFAPAYVNLAVEVDKYLAACGTGAKWDALVEVERAAYDAVKQADERIVAFVSVNAEDLYGQTLTGFDRRRYEALSRLKRDRLGLSSYPSGLKRSDGSHVSPADLPTDYFVRARIVNPQEAPVVIAETGWNSRDLKIGPSKACTVAVRSSPSTQDDYLRILVAAADASNLDLVTWWSNRDLLPSGVMETCHPLAPPPSFGACAGDPWCLGINIYRRIAPSNPAFGDLVFKGFGSMGLRDYDGTPKPSLTRWKATLARPTAGESTGATR